MHRSISRYYAIRNLQEAKDFLKDPVLGEHLNEISEALLSLQTDDPYEVFGSPDDMKLLSCMTLFEQADLENKIFSKVIDKFYGGSLMMGNMMNAASSIGLGSIWIHRAKEEFEIEEGKKLLTDLGITGEWEGIGHCAIGYTDGEPAKAAPRKDNRVFWAE